VFAGLIAFWVVSLNAPDDGASAQDSPPASTSAEATESDEPAATTSAQAEETEATEATEATSEAPADPLSADNITAFLEDYHRLVLSDPRAAYARTGPTLRAAIGEDDYVNYWGQFSDVRIGDIRATDGQNTATGTLELRYPDGTSESGAHRFTFLVQDGQLILDSDFPA
jgi:hypothetical protein